MSDREFGWLCGMMDGEGSIGVLKNKTGYSPSISFFNTVSVAVDTVGRLIRELRINPGFSDRQRGKNKREFTLYVKSVYDCKTLLEFLIPGLVVRAAQAKTLLEFVDIRTARRGKLLGLRELELVDRLHDLNKRGL